MLEARHYSATAQAKGSYALPEEYDGKVSEGALYHAVRAFLNNRRQGTASTKTRSEVSGGSQKPWRQKGTGRARQGTIRAAQWVGGGVVFGPKPRSYRTDLPKKVRQLARRSALNARASEGAICVIESLDFEAPKTRQMVELLEKLELSGKRVLVLTEEALPSVYRSGRNLQNVHVMRYRDATAFEVLWADSLLIEEAAVGGHPVPGSEKAGSVRAKRAKKAAEPSKKRATAKKKAPAGKGTGKAATKKPASKARKGSRDA